MINLSDGGKDAVVLREFNTKTRRFVEDGFITPESKGGIDWLDENTVMVSVDGSREIFNVRSMTFYAKEYEWVPRKADGTLGETVNLPLPEEINIYGTFKDQFLVQLNEDWRGFKSGDLVSFDFNDFMAARKIEDVALVFSPDEKSSMGSAGATKSKLLLSISRDVKGSAYAFDWDGKTWTSEKLDFPANGTVSIGATNDKEDVAFISSESE